VNTLIIYCHPSGDSHNRRILDAVRRGLDSGGAGYEVVDLYGAAFDPLLKAVEYERMFVTRAPAVEEDVRAMQAKVTAARNLVFVYPVWWYAMPAGLKGFLDRVFAAGFAYRFRPYTRLLGAAGTVVSFIPGLRYLLQPYAVRGLLKGKRAYIFRTYGGVRLGRRMFGNTPTVLENAVLRFCGITRITVRELYGINLSTHAADREARYLRNVERIAAGIRNA
jgi:NAD(P)H dehydrogenase (quinone)